MLRPMPKRQAITFRLPEDLHAEVERRAAREHRTLANTVVAIVMDAMRPPPEEVPIAAATMRSRR